MATVDVTVVPFGGTGPDFAGTVHSITVSGLFGANQDVGWVGRDVKGAPEVAILLRFDFRNIPLGAIFNKMEIGMYHESDASAAGTFRIGFLLADTKWEVSGFHSDSAFPGKYPGSFANPRTSPTPNTLPLPTANGSDTVITTAPQILALNIFVSQPISWLGVTAGTTRQFGTGYANELVPFGTPIIQALHIARLTPGCIGMVLDSFDTFNGTNLMPIRLGPVGNSNVPTLRVEYDEGVPFFTSSAPPLFEEHDWTPSNPEIVVEVTAADPIRDLNFSDELLLPNVLLEYTLLQTVGESATITTGATTGTGSSLETAGTFRWTPTGPGDYGFVIQVKDPDDFSTFQFWSFRILPVVSTEICVGDVTLDSDQALEDIVLNTDICLGDIVLDASQELGLVTLDPTQALGGVVLDETQLLGNIILDPDQALGLITTPEVCG